MSAGIQVAWPEAMNVGECPLWHAEESNLYWVDINGFMVHRLHPSSGAHASWRMPTEPSTLGVHADGGLLVATRAGFVHLNTSTGAIREIAAAPYDTTTTRFNDGRCDPQGRFWVGTIFEPRSSPSAEMYCLEKGSLRKVWSGGMTVSNGLGFSPDGATMYHADTTSHRIDRYAFNGLDGTVGPAQRFQSFSMDKSGNYGGRPDGAAVDAEGCYWIAMFEGARILRYAPTGELLRDIPLPVRCPTMLAFGGEDFKTLYITSAGHGRPGSETATHPLNGRLLSLRVDTPGRPEPIYQP